MIQFNSRTLFLLQFDHDIHLNGMFDKFSCKLILLDLLFNNGKYEEVIRVYNRMYEQQAEQGLGISRLQNVLMFGSCYKLV